MSAILLVIALILFILAAFGVKLGSVGLTELGLAFFVASFLFTHVVGWVPGHRVS